MIRPATPEDSDQIASIYNHYIANTTVTFEEAPLTSAQIETRLATGTWLVSEQAGQVLGYAYASQWAERIGYRHSVETTIYLDHEHLGKGLGFELYSMLLERLRTQQLHSAVGIIGLPNPGSVALHEKLGFQKVGELKEIGSKFGEWVNVGYWQLLF